LSFSKEGSTPIFLSFRENWMLFIIKFIKTGLPNY
jgi:hypothetical protein